VSRDDGVPALRRGTLTETVLAAGLFRTRFRFDFSIRLSQDDEQAEALRAGPRAAWSSGSEEEEGGAGGEFGDSVALSSAGDIALVGAPEANDHTGAARVFAQPLKAAAAHVLDPR
jgi:hypothetical protein